MSMWCLEIQGKEAFICTTLLYYFVPGTGIVQEIFYYRRPS